MLLRHPPIAVLALAALLLLAVPAQGQSTAKPCDIDAVPAATLLIPYFEVDLRAPGLEADFMTLFAVTNTNAATRIAHVTLWSDWAIPVANFDVVLTGFDVQTFDVGLILNTPDAYLFAERTGCQGNLRPGRLHFHKQLPVGSDPAANLAILRAALSGQPIVSGGKTYFASSGSLGDHAVGYITVDLVKGCTELFPSDEKYFKTGAQRVATNFNYLMGDYTYILPQLGVAGSDPAVHIRADSRFTAGQYTFYGRYFKNKAAYDQRQPLGSLYGMRYLNSPIGSGGATALSTAVVWRDNKSAAVDLVEQGKDPAWDPLPLKPVYDFDEQEHLVIIRQDPGSPVALHWATQRIEIENLGTHPFGWLRFDLNYATETGRPDPFPKVAQGWVVGGAAGTLIPPGQTSPVIMGYILRALKLGGPCK